MRDNGPVTGVEAPFPAGKTIVSKTDLAGRITEVNDTFVEISGYSADELIGKAHNLVRHPDVPPEVFEHLWTTLKQNRPWRGVVKNRCKNGDHYWVDAYVVPLRRHGQTEGYMSVRMQPTRAQIEQAQADYAAIRQHGLPRRARRSAASLSVRHGVLAGVIFVLAAVLFGGFIAIRGIDRGAAMVRELQGHNDLAALVARNTRNAASVQSQVLLALQHGPDGQGGGGADRLGIGDHLALIREGLATLERSSQQIARQATAPEPAASDSESATLQRYVQASQQYIDAGIRPLLERMTAQRLDQAQATLIDTVGPLAASLDREGEAVARDLSHRGQELQQAADRLYEHTVRTVGVWLILTMGVLAVASAIFFRTTIAPLKHAIALMERIAGGTLSERVPLFGLGEPGQVVDAVATMQVRLKVMLDEIQRASSTIGQQVVRLNGTVVAVVNSTEEQYQQASRINAALQDTGVDTRRLAACTRDLMQRADGLAAAGQAAEPSAIDDVARLAREAATLADLNAFAAQEMDRQSARIINLAAENRANANDAWTIGITLDETSRQLHGMLEKFD